MCAGQEDTQVGSSILNNTQNIQRTLKSRILQPALKRQETSARAVCRISSGNLVSHSNTIINILLFAIRGCVRTGELLALELLIFLEWPQDADHTAQQTQCEIPKMEHIAAFDQCAAATRRGLRRGRQSVAREGFLPSTWAWTDLSTVKKKWQLGYMPVTQTIALINKFVLLH